MPRPQPLDIAQRRVYVAGPMTGLPNYNFPAFAEATARLRLQGWDVVSPAEHDIEMSWVVVTHDSQGGLLSATKRDESEFDWATALDWDLKQLDGCDAIYLLPGWSKSRGACKEYVHATSLGLQILGAKHEGPEHAIQNQPLVGLVGFAQAGKDTFASLLGYRRLAFADALKALAVAAGPMFSDTSAGHEPLGQIVTDEGWEYAKATVPGVRELLQNLGTGVRDILGPETWVNAAFRGYDPSQPTVFTDVRFPNEVEAIRGRGGVIIRIDRPSVTAVNGHVSEFAWQSTEPDYVVRNGGSLDDLARSADKVRAVLEVV